MPLRRRQKIDACPLFHIIWKNVDQIVSRLLGTTPWTSAEVRIWHIAAESQSGGMSGATSYRFTRAGVGAAG
jgi:hypothetical protein